MARVLVVAWILWVLRVLFIYLLYLPLLFLWRLLLAIAVTLWNAARGVWNNRILTGVLFLFLLLGITMRFGQRPIMATVVDLPYECGVRPLAQGTSSVLGTFFAFPWSFWATEWNQIMLFIWDSTFARFGSSLQNLVRQRRIPSTKFGLGAVVTYIFLDELDDVMDFFKKIWEYVWEYFQGLGEAFVDIWQWLAEVFNAWFIDTSMFGLSCSLCSADPGRECALRAPFQPGQAEFDCEECHELQADFWGLVGGLLDAVFGNFVPLLSDNTSFRRIFRAVGCILRSLIMYPIQMVQGLVENATTGFCYDLDEMFDIFRTNPPSLLTRWFTAGDPLAVELVHPFDPLYDCSGDDSQICCGKPSSCHFPINGGEDLPIGMVPCFGELFLALSDDMITDWLEIALAFFAKIILDVILTVTRTIDCFSLPAFEQCLQGYPFTGSGQCLYSGDNPVPSGGIHQCFNIVGQCLIEDTEKNAPLYFNLEDFIEILFNDLWKFTVDFAVCPFATLAICFDPMNDFIPTAGTEDLRDLLSCLADVNPIFGPIFSLLEDIFDFLFAAVEFAQSTANLALGIAIQARALAQQALKILNCLDNCFEGGDSIEELLECFSGDCCGGSEHVGCEDSASGDYLTWRQRTRNHVRHVSLDEPTSGEIDVWRTALLQRLAISPNSFCGTVLYETPHNHTKFLPLGDFVTWRMCMVMYGQRYKTAQQCAFINNSVTEAGCTQDSSFVDDFRSLFAKCEANNVTIGDDDESNAVLPSIARNFTFPKKLEWVRKINATEWEFVPYFLSNVTYQIKRTSYWQRFEELRSDYTKVKDNKEARDDVYVAFSNDILSRYRTGRWRNETRYSGSTFAMDQAYPAQYVGPTGKVYSDVTMKSLEALPQRLWDKMASIGVIQGNETSEMRHNRSEAKMDPKLRETFETINSAIGLEYQSWFQGIAGFFQAFRMHDSGKMLGIVRGKVRYSASTGKFMSPSVFEMKRKMAMGTTTSFSVSANGRTFDVNLPKGTREARVYRPFPFYLVDQSVEDETDQDGPTLGNMMATAWKASVAEDKAIRQKTEGRKSHQIGDFDANQLVYDLFDAIFALFGFTGSDDGGLFNDLVANTQEFVEGFDFVEWSTDNLTDTVNEFFSCSIPENIDGTSLYSPFCVLLLNEDAFSIITPVTDDVGQFPSQVPWPDALVKRNCTTVYNGNVGIPNLIDFEITNNCDLNNGAFSEDEACDIEDPCVGSLAMTVREVDPWQRVVEYTLDQSGSPTCAVRGVVMAIAACADIEDIQVVGTGSTCEIGGWLVNSTDNPGCGFNATANFVSIDLTFEIGASCKFNIIYDERVRFTASTVAARVESDETFDGVCSECQVRLPVLDCIDPNADPVDLNPNLRPFCGTSQCDYCNRSYFTCAEAGFVDVVDTFFYILGVAPRVLDFLIFDGFPVKQIELWLAPAITIVAIAVGAILLPACCIGLPVIALVQGFAYMLTWFIFVWVANDEGNLAWGLVLFATFVYAQTRRPKWWELLILTVILLFSPGIPFGMRLLLGVVAFSATVPSLRQFLLPIFVVINLVFLLWLLSLVFEFPVITDVANINQAISDILGVLDDKFILSFIDFTPLQVRVDKFIYPTGTEVPDLHTFCFYWSLDNIALLMLIFVFGGYFVVGAFRFFWPWILFLIEIFVWGFALWVGARTIATRQRTLENEEDIEEVEEEVASISDRFKNFFRQGGGGTTAASLLRRIEGRAAAPSGASPLPHETSTQFRRRMARENRDRDSDADDNGTESSDDHATLLTLAMDAVDSSQDPDPADFVVVDSPHAEDASEDPPITTRRRRRSRRVVDSGDDNNAPETLSLGGQNPGSLFK